MMRVFLRVCFALILGCLLALYAAQRTDQFSTLLQAQLTALFESMFECHARCTFKRIDLFSGELEADGICVTARDGVAWRWSADRFYMHFSWLHFFKTGKLGVDLTIYGIDALTHVQDGTPAIMQHLKKIVDEALDLPAELTSLLLRTGRLSIIDMDRDVQSTLLLSSESINREDFFTTKIRILGGSTCIAGMWCADDLHGNIDMRKANDTTGAVSIRGQLHANAPCIHKKGSVTLLFEDGIGSVHLQTDDNECVVDLTNIAHTGAKTEADVFASLPLSLGTHLLPELPENLLTGTCHIAGHGAVDQRTGISAGGIIQADQVICAGYPLGAISGSGSYDQSGISIRLDTAQERGALCMNAQFDQFMQTGTISLENNAPLFFVENGYWHVDPHEFSLTASLVHGALSCRYASTVQHTMLDTVIRSTGSVVLNNGVCRLTGVHDGYAYACDCAYTPTVQVRSCVVRDPSGMQVATAESDQKNSVSGTVDFACIRALMKKLLDYDVRGVGSIGFKTRINGPVFSTNFQMNEAHIQVPETYNFVNQCTASLVCDIHKKQMICNDLHIGLHRGSIESKRATVEWHPEHAAWFIHAPLIVQQVFLNVQRDLIGVVSGSLLCATDKNWRTSCKGLLTVDRGRLKKNIFSSRFQQLMMQRMVPQASSSLPAIDLDISVRTKKAMVINTPFMDTDLAFDIGVKGTLADPQVTGDLGLLGGTITVAHRPLYITRCKLYFLPNRLFDPTIELVAQGRVKKYHITVRVAGTVQDPHFNFESTPPLSDDQIITLLLSGSEEGSLLLAMPSLIMKNIQKLIVDPDAMPSKFEGYMKHLLIPLKHIRIVPSFVDQTGRGGFRGAIEIDVNDQLHALIQKNFSLSEDTKFEVEYLLSDDISIRGIKDERGDLGGEIEVRWKF